ncbi:hypothetical protein CO046_03480 [Candidatus Peregrinibacteria bacterium CG_4_9_14_0_2_um_filter_53_11]|nr:MAG: hypothetical protein CO046_03480 [Candidatus Peregrinibacteria bacterium CG_4_9_14_0_2_um_filter_53_11]
MISMLRMTRLTLILILTALLPFHAFGVTWLSSIVPAGTGLTLSVSWKEILMLALVGILSIEILYRLRPGIAIKTDWLDRAILGYLGLSLIWLIIQRETPIQWLFGFRLDVLPFLLLLLIRHVPWSEREKSLTIKTALWGALAVMTFGLLQATVLPRDLLTKVGYSQEQEAFEANRPLTACQQLEHTPAVCRAIATFGGPTRYGSYLLVIIGLTLVWRERRLNKAEASQQTQRGEELTAKIGEPLLLTLALVSIALTYSRSIWLGLATMLGLWALFNCRRRGKAVIAGLTLLVALGGFLAYELRDTQQHNNVLKSIFTRTSSTSAHLTYLQEGVAKLSEHPWGLGLGTVGAASIRFEPFLTENWFLQIALEFGPIGLLLFLTIIGLILAKLLKKNSWAERGLALSLVGILVAGLFTHSFEEVASIFLLILLIGFYLPAAGRSPEKVEAKATS